MRPIKSSNSGNNEYNNSYNIETHPFKYKNASILTALGLHALQNQIAKKMITSKDSESVYRHMFNSGARNINPSNAISVNRGVIGSLVPEVNVIAGMTKSFGEHLNDNLKNTPLKSYSNLNNEHKGFLKSIANGDFSQVAKRLHEPEYQHLTSSFLKSSKAFIDNKSFHENVDNLSNFIVNPENKNKINLLKSHLEKSPTLGNLEKAYKGSYLQKSLPNIFNEMSQEEVHALSDGARSGKPFTHVVPEAALNAGLFAVDPITAVVNSTKRFMTSPAVSKIPVLNKVQKTLSNTLVNNPLKRAWNEGVKGEFKPAGKIETFIKRDLINPLDFDMEQLSGRIGQVVKDSPELKTLSSANTLMEAQKQRQYTGNNSRYARAVSYQTPKLKKNLTDMGYDSNALSGKLNYASSPNSNVSFSGSINIDEPEKLLYSLPYKINKAQKIESNVNKVFNINKLNYNMNNAVIHNPRISGDINGVNVSKNKIDLKSFAKSRTELHNAQNNMDEYKYKLKDFGIYI